MWWKETWVHFLVGTFLNIMGLVVNFSLSYFRLYDQIWIDNNVAWLLLVVVSCPIFAIAALYTEGTGVLLTATVLCSGFFLHVYQNTDLNSYNYLFLGWL